MHSPAWSNALALARPLLIALCASASVFYLYALLSARDLLLRRGTGWWSDAAPPISILKPLRGLDVDAAANFTSFFCQEYGTFEILVGAEDEDEPSLAAARRVARAHPEVDARFMIASQGSGANPKVRTVADLARHAKYPLLLVSDSDIRVGREHLKRMV